MDYSELSKAIGTIRRQDASYWQTVIQASNTIITALRESGVPGNMVSLGNSETHPGGIYARLLTLKTSEKKGSGFLSGSESYEVQLVFKVSLDAEELLHIYINDFECGTARTTEESAALLMDGFIAAEQARSAIETGQTHLTP